MAGIVSGGALKLYSLTLSVRRPACVGNMDLEFLCSSAFVFIPLCSIISHAAIQSLHIHAPSVVADRR